MRREYTCFLILLQVFLKLFYKKTISNLWHESNAQEWTPELLGLFQDNHATAQPLGKRPSPRLYVSLSQGALDL